MAQAAGVSAIVMEQCDSSKRVATLKQSTLPVVLRTASTVVAPGQAAPPLMLRKTNHNISSLLGPKLQQSRIMPIQATSAIARVSTSTLASSAVAAAESGGSTIDLTNTSTTTTTTTATPATSTTTTAPVVLRMGFGLVSNALPLSLSGGEGKPNNKSAGVLPVAVPATAATAVAGSSSMRQTILAAVPVQPASSSSSSFTTSASSAAASASSSDSLKSASQNVASVQQAHGCSAPEAAQRLGFKVFTRFVHTAEQLQELADEVSLEYMPPWALKDVPRPQKEVKPWRTSAPTEEELVRLETLIQGTLDWINGRKGQIGCSELGTLLGLLDRTRKMLFEIYMGLKRPKELDKEDTYFMGPGKETYTRRQHLRGHYREDEARRVWARVVRPESGKIDERGIIINTENFLIHCSPDGIYKASNVVYHAWMLDDCGKPVLVEIKAPVSKCFPEVDTRVLTSFGFLFLDQIEAHLTAGRSVMYACYDPVTSKMQYCPGKLVFPESAPKRFVEFTEVNTKLHWSSESDAYGRKKADSVGVDPAQHLSLRVTPDHDMYVQVGNRVDKKQGTLAWVEKNGVFIPPEKMAAHELAPSYVCECKEKCLHGRTSIRMLAAATEGLSTEDVLSIGDIDADGPVVRLGLTSEAELAAFLEFYGYWLGDGSIGFNADSVLLATFKEVEYLRELLPKCGLREGFDWYQGPTKNPNGNTMLYITKNSWFRYFEGEYWLKYTEGRRRRLSEEERIVESTRVITDIFSSKWTDASCYGASTQAKLQELHARGLSPQNTKSSKWFWPWTNRVNKAGLRLIIRGVHIADGHWCASTGRADTRYTSDYVPGSNSLFTSSVSFRDELVRMLLHAGYSTHFSVCHPAGPSGQWNSVPKDNRVYSTAGKDDILSKEPSRKFTQIIARSINWVVSFSDQLVRPNITVNDVIYDGGQQAPQPNKIAVGWVAEHKDGHIVEAATMVALGALIHATWQTIGVNYRKGYRTRSGYQVFKADVYYSKEKESEIEAQDVGQVAPDYDLKKDGRVWCVSVEHEARLIFAQRAFRGADGIVTKASRPIIVGNCYSMSEGPAYKKAFKAAMATIQKARVAARAKMEACAAEDPKKVAKVETVAAAAARATVDFPTPTLDVSKGEQHGVPTAYACQVIGQMGATMQKLGARVCDFVPHWRFDDLIGPKFNEATGRFLLSHTQGTRVWHNEEFFDVLYKEVETFCRACQTNTPPQDVTREAMLAKFPPLKIAPMADVRVWLSPRKDDKGKYIYGKPDEYGTPQPEIEMGDWEGKPYKKRLKGNPRCLGLEIPINSQPRYVTLKEFDQEYYDPVTPPQVPTATDDESKQQQQAPGGRKRKAKPLDP